MDRTTRAGARTGPGSIAAGAVAAGRTAHAGSGHGSTADVKARLTADGRASTIRGAMRGPGTRREHDRERVRRGNARGTVAHKENGK